MFSEFPPRTVRFRIALAYFLGALLVSGIVAVSTYALASTFLTRQRTDSVVHQSFNSLRFASEYLSRPPAERSLEGLVGLLESRGTGGDVIVVQGERRFSSSVTVTPEALPADLYAVVDEGEVGYVPFALGDGVRRIAFGSPVPTTDIDAYFVYSLRDLDETLWLLARILLVVVAGSVLVAGLLGWRLAGRTIEPLRRVSEASQRVAEGLLETRIEVTGRDELGRLADSFNTMAEALQERIARERRFVADVSHELRTPLTALKTSVDYLAERASDLPPRFAAATGVAAQEVRSLQRLVDDLLELSRVEAGGVHIAWGDVELGQFAREVAHRRAPGAAVTVSASEEVVVRTDKARLERVVGNLLENAMVHGRGEDVRLEVEDEGNGCARVTVSDRGPGIAPEDASRIFDRFWRADQARQRGDVQGAGLGLAIARENAHVIGAELAVESVSNGGARFVVRLPVGEEEP